MNGRRQKRFQQLDLQMEAITDAMIMASQEPDPERRTEKLAVVERAFAAYHEEHKAVLSRPRLRAIQGGAAIAAAALATGSWLKQNPQVTVGAVAAAAAATVGLLLFAPWRGQIEQGPPASAPSSTAPPSPGVPSPSPSGSAPSSPPPASSPAPSESSAPSAVPTLTEEPTPPAVWETPEAGQETTAPGPEPEESRSGPGRGTGPEVPPGLDEDKDPPGEGRPDGPADPPPPPPPPEECVLMVDAPLVDVQLGDVLCV